MENPLADLEIHKRNKDELLIVMRQTEYTRIQLHDRRILKNKSKLALAINEIRDFADILETLEY